MQKLLINKYDDLILYDPDRNSIRWDISELIEVRLVFLAEEEGQVITDTEVVDYNKGDLVLVLKYYGESILTKIVVCSDIVAKDDIFRWKEEIKKIDSEDETI